MWKQNKKKVFYWRQTEKCWHCTESWVRRDDWKSHCFTNVHIKLRHRVRTESEKCSPLSLASLPRTVLPLSPRVFPLVAKVTRFVFKSVADFPHFNTGRLEVRKQEGAGRLVTNSAVSDQQRYVYYNMLQKLQWTWITNSRTATTNAGRLREMSVSAALGAEKESHCASSACSRPSPPPLHYSGFYSLFFAEDSETHPIFSHLQQQQQHTSMAMKMAPASTDMVMISTWKFTAQ